MKETAIFTLDGGSERPTDGPLLRVIRYLLALSINRLVYNRCGYGNFVPTILSALSLNTGDVHTKIISKDDRTNE